jgi:RNA polymerase sigma-70 factor, ECF subfamily
LSLQAAFFSSRQPNPLSLRARNNIQPGYVGAWTGAAVTHIPAANEVVGKRPSDLEVVRRLADGDRTALADLYDRHSGVVYSLAYRIVGSADAEDVVQDVFAQAWRQAARYDPDRASAAAWLLNMTRTRAIDRLRANRTRQRLSIDDGALGQSAQAEADQEQGAIHAERASRVRAALGMLAAAQRQALELAYYAGLTHNEIAERLGEPLGTIKTRIRSALLKLRAALLEQV